ncbi:MAG: hypothetical protein IPF42_16575 [Candidatus Microthrix sp.]|nr:hypothetical protein [Candidatus Microthrix sp.]
MVDKLTNSSSVELPGSETVPGTGSQFTVWATASNVNCTVNGGDVAFNTSASTSQSTDVNGESFDLVGWFDTTSGQDYSVGCDGLPGETFSVIELPFSAPSAGIGLLVGSVDRRVWAVLHRIDLHDHRPVPPVELDEAPRPGSHGSWRISATARPAGLDSTATGSGGLGSDGWRTGARTRARRFVPRAGAAASRRPGATSGRPGAVSPRWAAAAVR